MSILTLDLEEAKSKIKNREVIVTVVGLGKMGLPLATVFTNAGFKVKGLDIVPETVKMLNEGKTTIDEPEVPERLQKAIEKGLFHATTDPEEALKGTSFVVIIIPVLTDDKGNANLKGLLDTYGKLAGVAPKGTVFIQESTLPPRTTSDVIAPFLEEKGLRIGSDVGLVFAPERTFSGRAIKDIEENYPKIIGSVDKKSGELAKKLYEQFVIKGVIQVSDATTAEAIKTFKGAYRDANIAIANQLAILADSLGVDILEVVKVANTEPFSHIHTPGIGVGGHCIPVYPHFVIQKGKENDFIPTIFVEGRMTNDYMVEYALDMVDLVAPDWTRNVLVLGLAYRGGVKEHRLSPTLRLIPLIKEKQPLGVKIFDPLYSAEEIDRLFGSGIGFENDELERALEWASIIFIVTDHDEFKEINPLNLSNKIVFDGRYVIDPALARDFYLLQPGRIGLLERLGIIPKIRPKVQSFPNLSLD